MKKFTLLFASCCFSALSFAQTLPNPGFETWVNNSESPHTYSVPQGWITVDVLESWLYDAFGDPTYVVNSVTQVGSAHGGTKAIQMSVVISNQGDTIGGSVYSEPSANNFFAVGFGGPGAIGFPYTTRSANLTGWRKCNLLGGDTAGMIIILTKWNTATSTRDTLVDIENFYFTTSAAAWTSFSIPLTYSSGLTPDTCLIGAGIQATTLHPGTTFTLDDLAFTGTVSGISELRNDQSLFSIFPNPFNSEATLRFNNVKLNNAALEIYDVLGNKVRVMENLNGEDVILNREGLKDGMYFYSLVNEGEIIATGKLSVQE